jgi:hypothetical protein
MLDHSPARGFVADQIMVATMMHVIEHGSVGMV